MVAGEISPQGASQQESSRLGLSAAQSPQESLPTQLRCLCGVTTLAAENRPIVTRITACPSNYEENLKCKIVLQQIRPHFTAARFSLFADCDKRAERSSFTCSARRRAL